MWKDFFYFSKTQRVGIVFMLILIFILITSNYLLPYIFPGKEITISNFMEEVNEFENSLQSRDSIQKLKWQQAYELRQAAYENKYMTDENIKSEAFKKEYVLFSFDPNTIDSVGLVDLGLKPYVASTILKYRKKGGVFKTANDFSKVYGVSDIQFQELKSYIKIIESKITKNDSVVKKDIVEDNNLIVELNTADTLELMKIKGIGHGYAKGIVKFRKQTGGFVSVEQLKEIYGMREKNYNLIKPHCVVNATLVDRIKVNIASVDRLNFHPYISFYQAKAIYELRRRKGKLKSIEDFQVLDVLNTNDIEKIKPYLNFE